MSEKSPVQDRQQPTAPSKSKMVQPVNAREEAQPRGIGALEPGCEQTGKYDHGLRHPSPSPEQADHGKVGWSVGYIAILFMSCST
jgi:hypothetical protein